MNPGFDDGGGGDVGSSSGRPSRQDQQQIPNESNGPVAPGVGSAPESIGNSSPAVELEADGTKRHLTIDPARMWVAYVQVGGGQSALRLELQLPRGAPFALYGRRNAAPSITQHDFSQFIRDGAPTDSASNRFKRQTNSVGRPTPVTITYNTSLVIPVEPGRWFIAVYNDDLQRHQIDIALILTNEVATPCPDDCNGRGQCLNGKCVCRDGFAGTDCSTSKSNDVKCSPPTRLFLFFFSHPSRGRD